jgi:hypothetical protein
MRKILLFPVVLLAATMLSSEHSKAASYQGTYNILSGYTTGSWAGLFGYGTMTVARNGVVAYSSYFPNKGITGSGAGFISKKGVFSLNNGVTGSAVIYTRVGYGSFNDALGSGFFAVGR